MTNSTNRAHRRIAMWAAAVCLLTTVSQARAHPFAFDTSTMVGFEVLTAEDGAMEANNMVVVKYDGPIVSPMAADLRSIWEGIKSHSRFEKVILQLNSPGGIDAHGMEVVKILKEIRQQMSLATLVGENELCASMCVAIYIQGEERYASPASAWMFHGASASRGGVPSLAMTMRYFGLFKDRGIDESFVNFLFENRYVTAPGTYWMSGSELAGQSNVITRLLPNWKPAKTKPRPAPGILGRI